MFAKKLSVWPILSFFFSLVTIFCFFWLFSITPDSKNSFLFGFSKYRIVIGLFFVICVSFLIFITIQLITKNNYVNWLDEKISNKKRSKIIFACLLLLQVTNWLTLVILTSKRLYELRIRYLPLSFWIIIISFSILVWISIYSYSQGTSIGKKQETRVKIPYLFLLLVLYWFVSIYTGFGWEPDNFGWGRRMVPLLSWQVGLIWLLLTFLILKPIDLRSIGKVISEFLDRKIGFLKIKDITIILFFWAFAMVLWYIPIPGIEGYPSLSGSKPDRDSALYEVSIQSYLNGNGFFGYKLVSRPFYLFCLGILHNFSGNSYSNLAFYQTTLIAFLPGVLFLIGKNFGNRYVGFGVGLLSIFREFNSLLSSKFGMVSNSRMIMSDVPATLGICLITLFCFLWLKTKIHPIRWAIFTGGLLGCTILIRMQTSILIPLILVISFCIFIFEKKFLLWVKQVSFFLVAIFFLLLPWFLRNYFAIGAFILDEPYTQTMMIAQRFTTGERINDFNLMPGETDVEYSNRLVTSISNFVISNPGKLLEFTSSHFIRNFNDTILVLPYEFDLLKFKDNAIIDRAFWLTFIPEFNLVSYCCILINLFLFSLGLVFSSHRFGLSGLIPLFINLTYNFSNAISRNSGYRYMLPVDWISYLYYCIGAVLVINWFFLKTKLISQDYFVIDNDSFRNDFPEKQKIRSLNMVYLIAFLFLGVSLPISELLIPKKYPEVEKKQLFTEAINLARFQLSSSDISFLESYVENPNVVVKKGLFMLPNYLPENTSHSSLPTIDPVDKPRYIFMLISSELLGGSIISFEKNLKFPDFAEDTIVIGCKNGTSINVNFIFMNDYKPRVYQSDNIDICSP